MLGQPLDALPLTFLDLETTGLAPAQGHRVCEVALLRVRGDQVEQRLATLVDPERHSDPQAFAVNQISPEMLDGAPHFAEVAGQVLAVLQGSVLIAHNAPFDLAFLRNELARLDLPPPDNYVIDTLALARRLLRRSSYSLQTLAHDLGLAAPNHRAEADVRALRGLFAYLVRQLAEQEIATLDALLRYQRGLLPGQPEPVPPPLIDQALRERRCLRIIYRSRSSPEPLERTIQPLELTQESKGVYLRAYCYLRDDLRVFAIAKIEAMELV